MDTFLDSLFAVCLNIAQTFVSECLSYKKKSPSELHQFPPTCY